MTYFFTVVRSNIVFAYDMNLIVFFFVFFYICQLFCSYGQFVLVSIWYYIVHWTNWDGTKNGKYSVGRYNTPELEEEPAFTLKVYWSEGLITALKSRWLTHTFFRELSQTSFRSYHNFLQFLNFLNIVFIITVCPRSSFPFYRVSYYIKWVTTFWTHSRIYILHR